MIEVFAGRVARLLPDPVRRPLGEAWGRVRRRSTDDYSALGEQEVAARLFAALGIANGVAVDVAACDGVSKSNTLALYEAGWTGLAVEGDPARFAQLARSYRELTQVSLARFWVTPENVAGLLEAAGVPREFEFLNLDLDSYDHFVLAALLERFRPRVICAEINEKIPPPLRFSVRYDPSHVWRQDHFYGQSLSKLHELAVARDYALVELHYNNAFLVPREAGLPALAPEEAYRTGYLERADRLKAFPWNADMEPLHSLPVDEQVAFVREKFAAYEGLYDLDV